MTICSTVDLIFNLDNLDDDNSSASEGPEWEDWELEVAATFSRKGLLRQSAA